MRRGEGLVFCAGLLMILVAVAAPDSLAGDKEECCPSGAMTCHHGNCDICLVASECCRRCEPKPVAYCLPPANHKCLDEQKPCGLREVGHCLPDPEEPGDLVCQGWHPEGECGVYPDCWDPTMGPR